MKNHSFLIYSALLGGVVFLLALVVMISNFKIWIVLKNTIKTKIKSAPQGYVELQGNASVLGENRLTAPFSGRPCYWYAYSIEVEKNNSRGFKVLFSNASYNLISLNDGSGECVVSPAIIDATALSPESKKIIINKTLKEFYSEHLSPLLLDVIAKYGDLPAKITEWVIEEGKQVYAVGQFKTLNNNSTLYTQDDIDDICKMRVKKNLLAEIKFEDIKHFLVQELQEQNQLFKVVTTTAN